MSAMVYAAPATKVAAGSALSSEANTFTVPIEVSNSNGLMAMDIPLKFSEGVTLKEVDFENTRVSGFDFKIADIDNENHTVIIGLINQLSSAHVDALGDGSGPVANLVFEVDNPAVNQVSIEATETTKPRHAMIFVYQQPDGQSVENPKFDNVTVSLSGVSNPNVPDKFELMQNYPNPFNPSTNLSFTVPVATNYTLTIFNVLGQTVDQFTGFSEPGRVDISWNASDKSSGVYFYKLETNNFTETKKMILLK
jgi:hypothetical protein